MLLTCAGRMGWLQEAHLGAKTLSEKETTKVYKWENFTSGFVDQLICCYKLTNQGGTGRIKQQQKQGDYHILHTIYCNILSLNLNSTVIVI